jgi:DNA-directed RNA polymerase alpha subunit
MSQREEFSFVFNGVTVCFVKMYQDCWICSLPWTSAETLRKSVIDLTKVNVSELELTVRAANVLKAEGINTVYDLLQYSESGLLRLVNCGKKTVIDINLELKKIGFELRK